MDKRVEIFASDGTQVAEYLHVSEVIVHDHYITIEYEVKGVTKIAETNMNYIYHF